jgi:hypothetical protein
LKCKTKTETRDPEIVKTTNDRNMLKGKCKKCNTNKSMFTSEKNGGSLDFHKILSKLPGAPWSKYPNEKHPPGYNYLGANTRLDLRLNPDDSPKENEEPINDLDKVAKIHDVAYRNAGDNLELKHQADREMLEELRHVKPKTIPESLLTKVTRGLIASKLKLGLGIIIFPTHSN